MKMNFMYKKIKLKGCLPLLAPIYLFLKSSPVFKNLLNSIINYIKKSSYLYSKFYNKTNPILNAFNLIYIIQKKFNQSRSTTSIYKILKQNNISYKSVKIIKNPHSQ